MKRAILFGLGAFGAIVAAFPTLVVAAEFPPPPPTTYYGTAAGATPGQAVIAIVTEGTTSTVCGDGIVTTDAGAPVYVVDVIADAQRTGCGKAGRQVMFYFTPIGGAGGRVSTNAVAWAGPGPSSQALTLGAPVTARASAPMLAKDGSY